MRRNAVVVLSYCFGHLSSSSCDVLAFPCGRLTFSCSLVLVSSRLLPVSFRLVAVPSRLVAVLSRLVAVPSRLVAVPSRPRASAYAVLGLVRQPGAGAAPARRGVRGGGRGRRAAVAAHIFRESYAQCRIACRCRGRHSRSPRTQFLVSAAMWRVTARHRLICRSSSHERRPM